MITKTTIINLVAATTVSIMQSGCVGSPVHTSSLSINELQIVDNYTLCAARTPSELYYPSENVINEVIRRGIDCFNTYQRQPARSAQSQSASSAKLFCVAAMLQRPTRTGNFTESLANTTICDQDPYAHLQPDQNNQSKQINRNDIQQLKNCLRDKNWC